MTKFIFIPLRTCFKSTTVIEVIVIHYQRKQVQTSGNKLQLADGGLSRGTEIWKMLLGKSAGGVGFSVQMKDKIYSHARTAISLCNLYNNHNLLPCTYRHLSLQSRQLHSISFSFDGTYFLVNFLPDPINPHSVYILEI